MAAANRGTTGSRRIRRAHVGIAFVVLAVVASFAPIPAGPASAAAPSADLDQCRNGSTGAPTCTWVNANLGPNHSKYAEGDSVPFRLRFDNLAAGTHTVTVEWDTTKGGKHAYDYLRTYNAPPQSGATPCSGAGCTTSSTLPIPVDPTVAGAGVVQAPGVFTMWRGVITATSAYTVSGSYAGDSSTRISITFSTSTDDDPVLAWSGHIASDLQWGLGSSASGISGSPYHMRLIDIDGAGGRQDRSLKVAPGPAPGSITIVKQATPEGTRPFAFDSSDNGSFTLVDDGDDAAAPSNAATFGNLVDFYTPTAQHTYDFTETVPVGWQLSSIACSGAAAYTTDTATATASIKLEEGENVICTFSNSNLVPTITVSKTPSTATVPESGGSVTYAVSVRNNSTVESVTLTDLDDDKFGDPTTVTGSTCSTPQTILKSSTYNCAFTKTVSGDAPGTHVNVVTATATDDDGGAVPLDDDDATVTFTDVLPLVNVVKSASAATVRPDSAVTYTYRVTTSTTEELTDVTVVDDKCSPVGFVGGDTDADAKLDPAETWTYTCTATLTATTVNTVTASAEDDEGNTATDTDTATVDVTDPRIAIDKVANPASANPGATVTYGYTVTNPGDQPLSDVEVVDDKCAPVAFVGGDADNDGKLDLDEAWTYTCAVVVGDTPGSLTNIGTATAKDPVGGTVSAEDTETIAIVLSASLVREAETPRSVPAAGGVDLPRTGADADALATTGAALVFGGIALAAIGRRRRPPTPVLED